MRKLITFYLLCIMSTVATELYAQASNNSPGISDHTIRSKLVNTPAIPDGVAFKTFLNFISAEEKSGEEFAQGYLQSKMGLTDSRAAALLTELRAAREKLKSEIETVRKEIYCSSFASGSSNDELYRLFDDFDDLSERIADKHFALFKIQMNSLEAERFHKMIQSAKKNMGHVKLDHKRLYESIQKDPDNAIFDICSG